METNNKHTNPIKGLVQVLIYTDIFYLILIPLFKAIGFNELDYGLVSQISISIAFGLFMGIMNVIYTSLN